MLCCRSRRGGDVKGEGRKGKKGKELKEGGGRRRVGGEGVETRGGGV